MTTRSLIQNLRARILPPPKIQFPCPVCAREIEIKDTDSGADLLCPHCTAWIAAPVPDLNLAAQIRDQRVIMAARFQLTHGRKLVDLKRGRLKASVLRKQMRLGPGEPALPEALHAPAASAVTDVTDDPNAPFHSAVLGPTLGPNSPGTAITGGSPSASQARRRRLQSGEIHFQPLAGTPLVLNPRGDVLPWDEETGAPSRPIGSFLSGGGKVASLAGGAIVLITLLLFVKNELAEQRRHRLQNVIRQQERLEISLAMQLEEARKLEAMDFAREALAAPTWIALLPYVRHPNRVRPLMEKFYAEHRWTPITISEFVGGRLETYEGRRFFAGAARDAAGQPLVVGVEETAGGWKIDWEVLVPLADLEWKQFVADQPFESRTVRVTAIRRTPTNEMRFLTRVPEEEAFGIMLWGTDASQDAVYAVLRKDSPVARELASFLSVAEAKRMIIEAAFLPLGDGLRDDLITINRIVARGWTILEDGPPGEARSEKSDAIRNAIGLPGQPRYAWNTGAAAWERAGWKEPPQGW